MSILLEILDFIVLLLIIIHATRTVRKGSVQSAGSMLLSICIAVVLIVFGYVSFAAYTGLVGVSSTLTRVISLVVLLIMAGLIRWSWSDKPAA